VQPQQRHCIAAARVPFVLQHLCVEPFTCQKCTARTTCYTRFMCTNKVFMAKCCLQTLRSPKVTDIVEATLLYDQAHHAARGSVLHHLKAKLAVQKWLAKDKEEKRSEVNLRLKRIHVPTQKRRRRSSTSTHGTDEG
jgi:hypothetical protein